MVGIIAATPAAAAEDNNVWVMEAAETLAGMSRFYLSHVLQDEAKSSAFESSCEKVQQNAGALAFHRMNKRNSSKSAKCGSNPRKRLSEAEKEEQRLHRILANRESARESIRRKQAMLLDLSRRATDLLNENENLKKEKELLMKKYKSLKDRNDSLKLKMDPEALKSRETQEQPPRSHPSVAPYIWPSSFRLFLSPVSSHLPTGIDDLGYVMFVVPVQLKCRCCTPFESSYSDHDEAKTKTSSSTTTVEKTGNSLETREECRKAMTKKPDAVVSDIVTAQRRRRELMTMKKNSRKLVAKEDSMSSSPDTSLQGRRSLNLLQNGLVR